MNETVTGRYDAARLGRLRASLEPICVSMVEGNGAVLTAKGPGWSVRLYESGKVVVQGRDIDSAVAAIGDLVNLESAAARGGRRTGEVPSLTNMVLPRVGSDESGKGDYFGPLVTAAVLVPDEATQGELMGRGVRDSKLMGLREVRDLGPWIMRNTIVEAVAIGPERYNSLHREMGGNVNRVLGWAHARALENVLGRGNAELAVADQFGDRSIIENALFERGKKIELRQMPRAESDIAVAAASVVARHEYLRRMSRLSQQVGMELPRGASARVIEIAVALSKQHGFAVLSRVAKLHFKTTEKVRARL